MIGDHFQLSPITNVNNCYLNISLFERLFNIDIDEYVNKDILNNLI